MTGLSKKEQEQRMEMFSFPFMMLNILNNLIWLAYAHKIHDNNLVFPNLIGKANWLIKSIGAFVALVLMVLYLNVFRRKD